MKNEEGMTNEEAKNELFDLMEDGVVNKSNIALKMAIKALEQEPCEDCISREEAIRVAEQGQMQGYEWQFKKLCTLPSVTPQTRWIPCSERLPDDDEDYLVIDDKGECGVGYYRHTANAWDSTNFGWLEGIDRMDDYLDMPCGLSKVVAWMPLPELYKTESEKEK